MRVATIVNSKTLLFQNSALPRLLLCVRHHSTTKLFLAGFLLLQHFSFVFLILDIDFCFINFVWSKGLSYNTNETVLRDTFKQHGQIIEGKSNNIFSNVIDFQIGYVGTNLMFLCS
jgi:hypothetical protein